MYDMILLKDALFNTVERSGATVDYARGVVVGVVSGLMSSGVSFNASLAVVKANMPDDAREGIMPPTWE